MSNDEKILEYLAAMQQGMTGIQKEISGLKEDIVELTEDISELKENVLDLKQRVAKLEDESQFIRNTVIRIEIDHGRKLDAYYDGYKTNYDIISRWDPRITALERKVETHTFQIELLRKTE